MRRDDGKIRLDVKADERIDVEIDKTFIA